MSQSEFALKRKIAKSLSTASANVPGQLGDGYGIVDAGQIGYVYCRIGGKVETVLCTRVPPQNDDYVWVGYPNDEEQPRFQVLSYRSSIAAGTNPNQAGYAPASRYEWLAPDGGEDPLHVQLRQFMPLRVGPVAGGSMSICVNHGLIRSGNVRKYVPYQLLDLTEHIPTTEGNAAMVLITISTSGVLTATKGTEFVLASVTTPNEILAKLPDAPTDTAQECVGVRVYYGQYAIREGRGDTDIVDLRMFANSAFGVSGHVIRYDDSDLEQKTTLEFQGEGVNVENVDDKTIVTVSGGSASGLTTRFEPLVFNDEILIFNHDVLMMEVQN